MKFFSNSHNIINLDIKSLNLSEEMDKQCLGSSVGKSCDLVNYRESHRAGVQIPSEAPHPYFSYEYLNKSTSFLVL